MKSKDNRVSLLNCNDSLIYLASVIVYRGVSNKDVNFFSVLNGPKSFLTVWALKRTPDWYYKIMDRKERKKHGSRRS